MFNTVKYNKVENQFFVILTLSDTCLLRQGKIERENLISNFVILLCTCDCYSNWAVKNNSQTYHNISFDLEYRNIVKYFKQFQKHDFLLKKSYTRYLSSWGTAKIINPIKCQSKNSQFIKLYITIKNSVSKTLDF